MRAVVRQLCRVCGASTSSKADMDDHIEEKHGNNWAPAMLTRAKDQQEFKPCLGRTRWGSDLR